MFHSEASEALARPSVLTPAHRVDYHHAPPSSSFPGEGSSTVFVGLVLIFFLPFQFINKINRYKLYTNKNPQVLLQARLQPMRKETQIRPRAPQHPTEPIL